MGVINLTPDSFSDGGEVTDFTTFQQRLLVMGQLDALDLGAESTAPINDSISWQQEWSRLLPVLPWLQQIKTTISLDTYHVETIFKFLEHWQGPLIWNDVSGVFDDGVRDFLKNPQHQYVFCHNRVPDRGQSGQHMNFIADQGKILQELEEFFLPRVHPQVLFDPGLGFAKSYQENWEILDSFPLLQQRVGHPRWLLGFSRKSFLRRKYQLELSQREKLDEVHLQILATLLKQLRGEVWVRTHRPELLPATIDRVRQ